MTPNAKEAARQVCHRLGLTSRETEVVVKATEWCPLRSLKTYRAILKSYKAKDD